VNCPGVLAFSFATLDAMAAKGGRQIDGARQDLLSSSRRSWFGS
jgi:hypothetical protein